MMSTFKTPRVLLIVAELLLMSFMAVSAQGEDEAVSNALTAVDIIRLGDPDDDMIVGVAGNDYPTYSEIPNTAFDCREQGYPGYYADLETQCQVFHICVAQGRRLEKFSFLCPNGTIFNQQYLVCVWWYDFDCTQASTLYNINADIFGEAGAPPSSQPSNFLDGASGTAAASAPRGRPAQSGFPGTTDGTGSQIGSGLGSRPGAGGAGRQDTGGASTLAGRPDGTGRLPSPGSGLDAAGTLSASQGRPSTAGRFPTSQGSSDTAGGSPGGLPRFPESASGPGTSGRFPTSLGAAIPDGSLVGVPLSASGPGTAGGRPEAPAFPTLSDATGFPGSAGRPGTAGGAGGLGAQGGFTGSGTLDGSTGIGRPGSTGRFPASETGPGISAGRPGGGSFVTSRPEASTGFSTSGEPGTGLTTSVGGPGIAGSSTSAGRPGTGFPSSAGEIGTTGFTSSAGRPGTVGVTTTAGGPGIAGLTGASRPGTTGLTSSGRPGAAEFTTSAGGPGIAGGLISAGRPGTASSSVSDPSQTGPFLSSTGQPGTIQGTPSFAGDSVGSIGTAPGQTGGFDGFPSVGDSVSSGLDDSTRDPTYSAGRPSLDGLTGSTGVSPQQGVDSDLFIGGLEGDTQRDDTQGNVYSTGQNILGQDPFGQVQGQTGVPLGQVTTGLGQTPGTFDFIQDQDDQTGFSQRPEGLGQSTGGITQALDGLGLGQTGAGQSYDGQGGPVEGSGGFNEGQLQIIHGQSPAGLIGTGQDQTGLAPGQSQFTQGQSQGDFSPVQEPFQREDGEGYSYPTPATSLVPGSGVSSNLGIQDFGQDNTVLLIENDGSSITSQGNIQDTYNNQGSQLSGFQGSEGIINENTNFFNVQGNDGSTDDQGPQLSVGTFTSSNNNAISGDILLTDEVDSNNLQLQINQNQGISNTGIDISTAPQSTEGYSYNDPSAISNIVQSQSITGIAQGQVSDNTGTTFIGSQPSGAISSNQGGIVPSNEQSQIQSFTSFQPVSNQGLNLAEPQIINTISSGSFPSGDNFITSNNIAVDLGTGNTNTPFDITQQLQYLPPIREFSSPNTGAQSSISISQQTQTGISRQSQTGISALNAFQPAAPVSLTDSLKQEVVAPVTQAESILTFPGPENSISAIDIRALQQGYLPPVNENPQSTGNNFVSSVSTLQSFPPSITGQGSLQVPQPSSQGSLTPLVDSTSYPSSGQGTTFGSNAIISSSGVSQSVSAGGSSFTGAPAGSITSGVPSGPPSLPASSPSDVSALNVGANVGQSLTQSLEQGYLPPRTIRQVGRGENKIYVTPLPRGNQKKADAGNQPIARSSFKPSLQLTESINTLEFVPKSSSSKPFGRILFPSSRRSDGIPISYVDNTRRTFVATSSSPFNPYNKYSLSWRS